MGSVSPPSPARLSISEPDTRIDDDIVAAWGVIRAGLRHSLGARSFDHWLKPVRLAGYCRNDATVRLALPSDFMASWVQSHHSERLTQAWKSVVPHVQSVHIETDGVPRHDHYETVLPVSDVSADRPKPANPYQFDARFTFEQFITGPTNTIAANAARSVAAGGPMRVNPLYIHSQTGHGKTHLLHAIGHDYQCRNPQANVVYMSAERFMFEFVSAMRARDTISFKTRLRAADVLMIDDVQFIAGKESTQEEFLHTVDELMSAGKRLVISADRAPQALDGVEGRILSRLTQGLVIDVQPADFTLRRAILAAKVEAIDDAAVPPQVIDLLASRIASNIRELEGGLNRLIAYGGMGNRAITVDFAEEVLADMFRASRRRITIDEIQKYVSDHFKIRNAEMVSARRAREVARPRQIAMYLAKQLTPRSLPEIGRRFGGRDHTTVIHAVKQIEKLRASDSEIDNDVRTLMRIIEG